jgi:integrase
MDLEKTRSRSFLDNDYSTLFPLAAASGLRSSEQLALRVNNIDLSANTVRVEESSDQRDQGKIGPCKNASAYRTVLLCDPEGQKAMYSLRRLKFGPTIHALEMLGTGQQHESQLQNKSFATFYS